jgi:Asp-tRNA(Asn)/Glu-tRNA(Gln) amidotransferase A subunit family amidase
MENMMSNWDGSENELAWMPGWQLRGLFVSRKLSPLEYAQFLLRRVARHADLGAFISVFPEHLLQQAAMATEQFQTQSEMPALLGMPVSVKDNVFTKGLRTTVGSRLFEDYVPDVDSVSVEQLKKAGAIIFAKNNTPEFAMSNRTMNLVSREAVNPWDRRRTSGGSSGGAGVAAAAGLSPYAVGTDGGGSIRLPSAFNGVFGLIPSRGRVPNGAGVFLSPMSRIGPMTRDVRDAATLLQVMACVDDRDPFTMRTPPADYLGELETGIKGIKVAWSEDLGRITPDDPDVVAKCHEAAKLFQSLGAIYSEPSIRLEDPHDPLEIDTEFSHEQVERRFRAMAPEYPDMMSWMSKLSLAERMRLAVYVRDPAAHSQLDYALGISPEVRHREKTRLEVLFASVDLLLCPTIARRAFICGQEQMSPWQYTAYTYLVNSAGYCAASVPAGFSQGMPVGLQIIGRPGEEALVLRAARAFERERPWAAHRPDLS